MYERYVRGDIQKKEYAKQQGKGRKDTRNNIWKCISEYFENGRFRYINSDGTPMQIEVTSDKYEAAIRVKGGTLMNEDRSLSFKEYLNYIKAVMLQYSEWSIEERKSIEKDIATIEQKLADNNLYLGVIGSFSSGKSTFINSLLNQCLLPTDAVQGTTVAASILKKAPADDMEITYSDGRVLRYSINKEELNKKYGVEPVSGNTEDSWFARLIQWLLSIFKPSKGKMGSALSESDFQTMCLLFKQLISTEGVAQDIEYATLELNNDKMNYDIAIVDTPGTESLNQHHSLVTKNAIDNICDAFVVIIPYDEPVSETLLDYLKSYLSNQLSSCIYVVTKVELLDDVTELPRLLKVITKRLKNGLELESPIVIPMPTLLHLESCNEGMEKSGLFNNIEPEIKSEMLSLYEDGLTRIYEILKKSRITFMESKLYKVCQRVSIGIEQNLCSEIQHREEKVQVLTKKRIKPITEFYKMAGKLIQDKQKHCSRINDVQKAVAKTAVTNEFNQFISAILDCSTSADILEELANSRNIISEIYQELFAEVDSSSYDIKKNFAELATKISDQTVALYQQCHVEGMDVPVFAEFDNSNFIEQTQNQAEQLLENIVEALSSIIFSDTRSFFKKVKSFFSNPTTKHKEMCETALNKVCSEVAALFSDSIEQAFIEYETITAKCVKKTLDAWVSENRETINGYEIATEEAISENTNEKEKAETILTNLRQYMVQLGGGQA